MIFINLFIILLFFSSFTNSFVIPPLDNNRINSLFRNSKAVALRTKRKFNINYLRLEYGKVLPSESRIKETAKVTLDDYCNIFFGGNNESIFFLSLIFLEILRIIKTRENPKKSELLYNIFLPIFIHECLRVCYYYWNKSD
jgi:hypothetical protein